jgi:hypothetical protein
VLLSVFLQGDFNKDGNVDAADYAMWRKFDGNSAEYDQWRENFGNSSVSVAATHAANSNGNVPEPQSLVIVSLVAASCCLKYRRLAGVVPWPLSCSVGEADEKRL